MVNENRALYLAVFAIVVAIVAIGLSFSMSGSVGPAGPIGATGPTGPQGTEVIAVAQPESCATCHDGAGDEHQASYDLLYQDGVITITEMAYEYTAPNTHTITFTMLKDGEPFDPADADRVRMYFVPYTGTAFQYEPAADRLAVYGTFTYDGAGGVTSILTDGTDARLNSSLEDMDGAIMFYGRDGDVARMPNSRVQQAQFPFAALLETGDGVDYVSAANNDGCEKCHTEPYLKHGYYYAQVNDDPTTDFVLCKACHLDNAEGGHFEWQLLVDDPELAADVLLGTTDLTVAQEAQYAYNMSLMNDVHMSHEMEFPYPQSMSTCVTCHEDKLDITLTDANFQVDTCKSCHPVTGSAEYGTDELSIEAIMPSPLHDLLDLDTVDCSFCHSEGNSFGAAVFSDIHTGYDDMIYAAPDVKYSDAVIVTVDDASLAGSLLTIKFSATEAIDIAGIDVADIVPTVLVGMYGYDTKDYIIGPHERLTDDNGDGEISRSSGDDRALEYDVGSEHPRFTTVTAAGGSWEVIADMSTWAGFIANGTVKRVEIAVIPELEDATGEVVSLNAPSRTFDLVTNDFDDDFYSPIVKLEDGCNNCHDSIINSAITYHGADRGGNIVVCRLCHITKSRGSHLEMQSRSIDSYIHAIHEMQPFDIGDMNFTDPVDAVFYDHHTGFPYPTHGITNCESCHVEGTYNVPDQTKSLPGVLSASDSPIEGWNRTIGEVPLYITGPASRACGSCHRAAMINEDDVNELISFNQHVRMGGYLIEAEDPGDYTADIMNTIDEIMANFK
ncbi:MAG: hypothetical protein V3V84_03485 [Candidatus Bathyarchaeia archaeon]